LLVSADISSTKLAGGVFRVSYVDDDAAFGDKIKRSKILLTLNEERQCKKQSHILCASSAHTILP
jgi:hypothetical protein